MLQRRHEESNGFYWLELLLLLSACALLLQISPSLATPFQEALAYAWLTLKPLLGHLDVRNWSAVHWMVGNVSFILALLGIRFGPDLAQSFYEDWELKQRETQRTERHTALHSTKKSKEHLTAEEAQRQLAEDWRQRAKNRLPFR